MKYNTSFSRSPEHPMVAATSRRTFQMLENESLWQLTTRIDGLLTDAGIAYAIAGGVAVSLHGYRRNTVDLDLLLRSEDSDAFRAALEAAGIAWFPKAKEFRTEAGVPVQVLIAGETAGPGQSALLPDPSNERNLARIEGLRVISLAELIQSKIACGLGDMRRTHKDFADVVELAAIHNLESSFARFLHKSVRPEFRALVKRAKG
jgi:hypothetical protein